MANSRRKGHTYEREIAQWYRERGFPDTRRGIQTRDGSEVGDLEGLPFSIECKHHKQAPNVFKAMKQAEAVAGGRPAVVHAKQTNQGEIVCVRLEFWEHLLRCWSR